MIEELSGGARVSWRDRFDVVCAGVAERVRAFGLSGLPPRERAREGSLLVLYAWTLFVLGGFGVQKASEHWTAATPLPKQGLPAAAFNVLVVGAAIGSTLVLLGVAVSLPSLIALIRRGGWTEIRRPIIRAVLVSLLAVVATFGLAAWAHSLTPAARNGHNAIYSGVFLAWVMLSAACLLTWASAAAAIARRLSLPMALLRLEVWLGAAVSASMAVMAIATLAWWAALATAAPWFFEGRPVGSAASALTPNMIVPAALMLSATLLGLTGTTRAVRALAASTRP